MNAPQNFPMGRRNAQQNSAGGQPLGAGGERGLGGAPSGFRRGGGSGGRGGHSRERNTDEVRLTGEIRVYADLETKGYGFIKPDKGTAQVRPANAIDSYRGFFIWCQAKTYRRQQSI